MAIMKTYDLKGNKLSFANWISNLSPVETPFTSMIKKEAVDQTRYSWQVDRLSAPMNTGFEEGSEFISGHRPATRVMENFTQILRKTVRITDTANVVGLYGRASEKAYQMEKAGKEIRRDLEMMVLKNGKGSIGTKTTARTFSGFTGLVAELNQKDIDTGAVVHKTCMAAAAGPAFTEADIFDMTYNLYLAGSKADKIMVHPKHMALFSGLLSKNGNPKTFRMFENVDTKFNAFVGKVRDPLGQEFTIIPNRHMSESKVFFFNENDWTQMILREPKTTELARNGSSERHMIEMEVGLRHRNPFASGVLDLKANAAGGVKGIEAVIGVNPQVIGTASKLTVTILKDGVKDTAATDEVTIASDSVNVVSPAAKAAVAGVATFDITGTAAGVANLKCSLATGEEVTVEFQVQTARKVVKAKAE